MDADRVVTTAVEDLQTFIEKMSGAKLPIVHGSEGVENKILVGRTLEVDRLVPELDQLDLGTDGVVIRLLPGKLIITSESVGYVSRVGRPNVTRPMSSTLFWNCLIAAGTCRAKKGNAFQDAVRSRLRNWISSTSRLSNRV